jgi:ribosomal RNA assembly protein
MHEFVRIPKQRIRVLIGKGGSIKSEIEGSTGTKISIVPGSSDVEIAGEDAPGVLRARDIVTAIGRGFAPRIALWLLKEDSCFDTVSLKDETENTVKRLMARVIGKGGSAKRKIERNTGAKLCIFGKTVSFVGSHENVRRARKFVEMLLDGRPHAKVFAAMLDQREESTT